MAPSLSTEAIKRLQEYIDNATTKSAPIVPGAILHIVDKENNTLFSHASGGSVPLSSDTLAIIYSCTKIIGAIAFMQLVERKIISLDDTTVIPELLPELAAKKVLLGFEDDADGKRTPKFEDRTTVFTPRMLMNHTNGTGHEYFNPLLKELLVDNFEKRNEVADPYNTILDSPLRRAVKKNGPSIDAYNAAYAPPWTYPFAAGDTAIMKMARRFSFGKCIDKSG
jgi:methyl acetate hydrolase